MLEGIKNLSELFAKMGDLKTQTEKMQSFLENLRVTGDAGAGMVRVVLDGKGQAIDVQIHKSLLDGDEVRMLEDLVRAAINDAQKKLRESIEYEYKKSLGIHPEEILNVLRRGGSPSG